MSLISACAVGIPTFLLAQENNYEKIDHTFLRHVFMNAFPAAVTITGCVFSVMLVCQNVYHSNAMLNTACVLVTGWNYMAALKTVLCAFEYLSKGDHLQYAGDLFRCGGGSAESSDTGISGIRNDHSGVFDDIFSDPDRCDHGLAQKYLQSFAG